MSMSPPPYMMSVRNVAAIFTKLKTAGVPPKFNLDFLKSNLGFSSSSDRGIIAQLKFIGFLSDDGTPTQLYYQYKGSGGEAVLASGIRAGYSEVFLADQKAFDKTPEQLKNMFMSLTGKGDSVAKKMASTFKSLCDIADFNNIAPETRKEDASAKLDEADITSNEKKRTTNFAASSLKLSHDIHIHLPPTSDVTVYKAIFRAINDELAD